MGKAVKILQKIMNTKRYWLIPLWVLFLAAAIFIFLAGHGTLLPAIYMSF
jgi:hypothetical protein